MFPISVGTAYGRERKETYYWNRRIDGGNFRKREVFIAYYCIYLFNCGYARVFLDTNLYINVIAAAPLATPTVSLEYYLSIYLISGAP